MNAPLLSIAYAPPLPYYALLAKERCIIEIHEHYLKQTFRNRCIINTPKGLQALIIPVEKGASNQCPIKEVRIATHDNWQHQHLQALKTSYGATPYFEYYIDDITHLYKNRYPFLIDFNLALIEMLARLCHLSLDIQLSEKFTPPNNAERDYRYFFHPKGEAKTDLFMLPPYYQINGKVSPPQKNISIYDLLFQLGPEVNLYFASLST